MTANKKSKNFYFKFKKGVVLKMKKQEQEQMLFFYLFKDKRYMECLLNEGITKDWFTTYIEPFEVVLKLYLQSGDIPSYQITKAHLQNQSYVLMLYEELVGYFKSCNLDDLNDGNFKLLIQEFHRVHLLEALADVATHITNVLSNHPTYSELESCLVDAKDILIKCQDKISRFFTTDKKGLTTVDAIGLSNYLMNKYSICKVGNTLLYFDKVYDILTEQVFNALIFNELCTHYSKSLATNIFNILNMKAPIKSEINSIYAIFNNVAINCNDLQTIPITNTTVFINHIPLNVTQNITPQDKQKVSDIFNAWTKNNKEKKTLLLELIGQCLSRKTPEGDMQKMFVLIGKGENGKSKFLKLLQAILGKNNYSNVKLKDILDDGKFNKIHLEHKLANINDDASNVKFTDVSKIKEIITGTSLYVANKYHDERNIDIKYLTLVIGTNDIPKLGTSSDGMGMVRRLQFIRFDRDFSKEKVNVDFDLLEHPEKYPEILAFIARIALLHYNKALERGSFTETEEHNQIIKTYEKENMSIKTWVDSLKEEEVLNKTFSDLYLNFKESVGVDQINREEQNLIKRFIEEKFPYLEYTQIRGESKCFHINNEKKLKNEVAQSWQM